MIQAKETRNDMQNKSEDPHINNAMKTHNEESTCHTQHAPDKEISLRSHNNDSDKDDMQIDPQLSEEQHSQCRDQNDEEAEQNGQKTTESVKQEDPQNLNTNNIVDESKDSPYELDQAGKTQDGADEVKEEV